MDNLSARELELLTVAVVYHDFGFLERYEDNESLGARSAVLAMKQAGGYSEEECQLVSQMILDTQLQKSADGLRQIPTTNLSRYLCDADLSNLGRTDFFDKFESRWEELGRPPRATYETSVYDFVTCHRWYTPAAVQLREAQKKLNCAALAAQIHRK